jgi:hypothetical protein
LTKPWQLETKKETMQKYVKYFYSLFPNLFSQLIFNELEIGRALS